MLVETGKYGSLPLWKKKVLECICPDYFEKEDTICALKEQVQMFRELLDCKESELRDSAVKLKDEKNRTQQLEGQLEILQGSVLRKEQFIDEIRNNMIKERKDYEETLSLLNQKLEGVRGLVGTYGATIKAAVADLDMWYNSF